MNHHKASGPDSYSMTFLKEDIMKVFHDFHAKDKFERSLNVTFIVLIPKRGC
jgi:hypothetical protein